MQLAIQLSECTFQVGNTSLERNAQDSVTVFLHTGLNKKRQFTYCTGSKVRSKHAGNSIQSTMNKQLIL